MFVRGHYANRTGERKAEASVGPHKQARHLVPALSRSHDCGHGSDG
jgi:hypothetical protein